MRVNNKCRLLGLSFAILLLEQSAVAQTRGRVEADGDEIAQALAAFGHGSPQEMLDRLRPRQSPTYTQAEQASVRESLPKHVVALVLNDGPEVERARGAAALVFKLHHRAGVWNVVVFKCEKPLIGTWYLQEVLISTAMVELLSDAELQAVLAHEVGHSYFVNEFVLAGKAKDAAKARVVKLQCDTVAVLSLILLGADPSSLQTGLAKYLARARELGVAASEYAPDLGTRQKLIMKVVALVKPDVRRLEV